MDRTDLAFHRLAAVAALGLGIAGLHPVSSAQSAKPKTLLLACWGEPPISAFPLIARHCNPEISQPYNAGHATLSRFEPICHVLKT
jgi:hypothetical protein